MQHRMTAMPILPFPLTAGRQIELFLRAAAVLPGNTDQLIAHEFYRLPGDEASAYTYIRPSPGSRTIPQYAHRTAWFDLTLEGRLASIVSGFPVPWPRRIRV